LIQRGLTVGEVFDGYAALVVIATAAGNLPTITQDPDDDQVLAAALGAQADLIVSGDRHLLDLGGVYQGIPIVAPAQALGLIRPG
jgi:predicted nucleic acid-binding protein